MKLESLTDKDREEEDPSGEHIMDDEMTSPFDPYSRLAASPLSGASGSVLRMPKGHVDKKDPAINPFKQSLEPYQTSSRYGAKSGRLKNNVGSPPPPGKKPLAN